MNRQTSTATVTRLADVNPKDMKSRAQTAAAVAAKNSESVDAAARFPTEAFDVIREQRLLGIMVPTSLGGEGASLGDVTDVCYQLAQACASTGMIYAMHQVKVACLVRHNQGSRAVEGILRREMRKTQRGHGWHGTGASLASFLVLARHASLITRHCT